MVFSQQCPQNEVMTHQVTIPEGTALAVFTLNWNNDWGKYPTDDLDLYATAPSSAPCDVGGTYANCSFDGASLSIPEVIVIPVPEPGVWDIDIEGYTVWGIHGGDKSKYNVKLLLY